MWHTYMRRETRGYMRDRLLMGFNKYLALFLAGAIAVTVTGCDREKKEPKPEPKATAKVDKGNANAGGNGEGQADVPLVAGTGTFSKAFNPFLAQSQADRQAVDLTQVKLVTNDRAGKIVYHGIDGELRRYKDQEYTYYGASDLSIKYDKEKDCTTYRIRLREDLSFSDGQKLTIDDVLFSLYVFCDNSYAGDETIKDMPIKGLLNYQANSTKAEAYDEQSLAKKIAGNGKRFKKWLRKQGLSFLAAQLPKGKISSKKLIAKKYDYSELFRQARIYFSKGKGKKVKGISGIRKLSDWELSIETAGYQRRMSAALQIPICALHYYGDMTKFQPKSGRFGFRRGDISSVLANKSTPMGAGAYRFVKYEDGVVYYTSNELYFLGCPQIAFLQLKEMTGILEETRKTLAHKVAAESVSQEKKQDAEETPAPTTNPSGEVTELKEGTVDVLGGVFRGEELNWITGVNSNQKLEGGTISAKMVSDGIYRYLGMHAGNVSVGGQAGSDASKSLRRAFAVLFSGAKTALEDRDGISVDLISHPMGRESWVVPDEDGERGYVNTFERNAGGDYLYASEDDTETRMEAARVEALKALERAGYAVEDGKVKQAPAGAALTYHLWIVNGEENPFYDMAARVAEEWKAIGMNLQIDSIGSAERLEKKLATGTQQMWIGMREISDVNLQGRYASVISSGSFLGYHGKSLAGRYATSDGGNLFGMKDAEIDRHLQVMQTYLTSKQRQECYQKCIDRVMDWGVEVPLCEYQDALLFSSSRIRSGSIPSDLTIYYGWMDEVQKIRMK